ncbi:MAG TPA: HNH endonuclease signature motif containing protein [Gryllotalpicola sp.]
MLRALGGAWDAPIAVALRNEWLSAAEAEALRSGLGAPSDPELATQWRTTVIELIADAWAAGWTAEALARAGRRARGALDGLAAQADAQRRFTARSLRRWRLASGNWRWDLEVDAETDAALWAPLSRRLSARLGGPRFRTAEELARATELEQDPRSNEQLLCDEFTGIYAAGVSLAAGQGAFGRAEPHVAIVVTTAELRKAREHRGPADDTGIAWVEGADEPVSALTALQALCDGSFTPVLFDESGRAIDVGRRRRLFDRRQRVALAVRDGGCLWPGCTRPPGECEAHHINPWGRSAANRRSETKDGVLLCRYHHLSLHAHHGWIAREGSVYWLHWPGNAPVRLVSTSGVRTQLHREGAMR